MIPNSPIIILWYPLLPYPWWINTLSRCDIDRWIPFLREKCYKFHRSKKWNIYLYIYKYPKKESPLQKRDCINSYANREGATFIIPGSNESHHEATILMLVLKSWSFFSPSLPLSPLPIAPFRDVSTRRATAREAVARMRACIGASRCAWTSGNGRRGGRSGGIIVRGASRRASRASRRRGLRGWRRP